MVLICTVHKIAELFLSLPSFQGSTYICTAPMTALSSDWLWSLLFSIYDCHWQAFVGVWSHSLFSSAVVIVADAVYFVVVALYCHWLSSMCSLYYSYSHCWPFYGCDNLIFDSHWLLSVKLLTQSGVKVAVICVVVDTTHYAHYCCLYCCCLIYFSHWLWSLLLSHSRSSFGRLCC